MSIYYTSPATVRDGDVAYAIDVNGINTEADTGFSLVEADITAMEATVSAWADLARKWAENPEDTEVTSGSYSAMHWALKSESFVSSAQDYSIESQGYSVDSSNAATLSATYASNSSGSADDSAASASLSLNYSLAAADRVTEASGYSDKAQKWAEEAEGVEVETGKYSAYHWSQKAYESYQLATNALTDVEDDIATNTSNIATNTSNIAANTLEITALKDDVARRVSFYSSGVSLPAVDSGPIIHADYAGLMVWQSFNSAAYVGYACRNIGRIVLDSQAAARSGHLPATGGSVSAATYAALWAWAQEQGYVVDAASYVSGALNFIDNGDGTFTLPDLTDQFFRAVGAGDVGRFQDHAFQGHKHKLDTTVTENAGSTLYISKTGGAGVPINVNADDIYTNGTNGTPQVASETRPMNTGLSVWIIY